MSSNKIKNKEDGGRLSRSATPSGEDRSRTSSRDSRSSVSLMEIGIQGPESGGQPPGSLTADDRPSENVQPGEDSGTFAAPSPVARPGHKSSKGRKRSSSAASQASSTDVEDEVTELDPPEDDPTPKRPREGKDSEAEDAPDARSRSRSPFGGGSGSRGRTRGRPPTTGEYVGRAKAMADLLELEQRELMIKADQELLTTWTGEPHATRSRKVLLGVESGRTEESGNPCQRPSDLTAADLAGQLQKSVEALYKIASYKKGYKGESIRVLKEVADVVSAAGRELASRTKSDESERLRRANTRLSEELADLRRQLKELREEVASMTGVQKAPGSPPPPTPGPSSMDVDPPPKPQREKRSLGGGVVSGSSSPPSSPANAAKRSRRGGRDGEPEEAVPSTLPLASFRGADAGINAIAGRVVDFVNARFAAIEGRLLPEKIRPPLGAVKSGGTAAKAKSFAEAAAAPPKGKPGGGGGGRGVARPPAASLSAIPKKGKGKQPRGKAGKATPATVDPPKAAKPPRAAGGSEWTTVGREGGKAAGNRGYGTAKATPSTSRKAPPPPKKGDKGPSMKGKGEKGSPQGVSQTAKPRRIRPPKMAAVLLSVEPPKEGERPVSLGGAIAEARASIKLSELGIASLRPKKAVVGEYYLRSPAKKAALRLTDLPGC